MMKRRDFLKTAATVPLAFLSAELLFRRLAEAAAKSGSDRVLLLVELNGGNDGLNMLVPYADKRYYAARPQLAVAKDSVLPLSDALGFNPVLQPLMDAWKSHELAAVLGVGYPNPNRSHFRSIEIWETGSDADQTLQEGWLSRLMAKHPLRKDLAADGVVIGRGAAGPLSGEGARSLIMQNPENFLKQAARVKEIHEQTDNKALAHLLSVQNDLHEAARVLEEKMGKAPELKTAFPRHPLGQGLGTAARLLASGTPVGVIKVSHGSFDTHADQRNVQDGLLKELAEALAAFREAMRETRLWDRVLLMTYSEFGRRAGENESQGTDHGTAAPHFLMGGQVKGGFHGKQPSLDDLDNGDLKFTTDYRRLYTTVAQGWWDIPEDVLGYANAYPALDCLSAP